MAISHPELGVLLGWKHAHAKGIRTSDGWLTDWPDALGAWPSDALLQQWIDEWEALPADDATKYPRAAFEKKVDDCRTLDELKEIVKGLR